jgi:undecaprenyl-phosphate 4-deoxy-4-formamido-L-arabinose transferase
MKLNSHSSNKKIPLVSKIDNPEGECTIKATNDHKLIQSSISVVVPVYNSEGTLDELVARLDVVLSRSVSAWEIVLVNDCSKDQSWQKIQALAGSNSRVRGINLMRNYGQHNTLLCGIRASIMDLIVTIDDDLQNPPEEIPRLLFALDEGYDVVYGSPKRQQHGLWRDLASEVTKLALKSAMGVDIARQVSAFRIFRRQVSDAFKDYRSPYVSVDVLLTWGSTRFSAIHVRHEPRTIGRSNYTFRKLVTHALNMLTGFSTMPLQFASLMGFVFTLFGLGVLVYVVGRYLIEGGSVAGFPFLASVIAIFSGAQLFALGIIGEYLARMHLRTMERPTYVVRSDTRKS